MGILSGLVVLQSFAAYKSKAPEGGSKKAANSHVAMSSDVSHLRSGLTGFDQISLPNAKRKLQNVAAHGAVMAQP